MVCRNSAHYVPYKKWTALSDQINNIILILHFLVFINKCMCVGKQLIANNKYILYILNEKYMIKRFDFFLFVKMHLKYRLSNINSKMGAYEGIGE